MKSPRDISGQEFIKSAKKFGYEFVRQNGSHVKLTTQQKGEHHLAVPNHNPLKIGMFNALVFEISKHFEISKQEVIQILFG